MSSDRQRSEILEALEKGRYYPSAIQFTSEFADNIPSLTLAKEYAHCLQEAGLGAILRYSLAGMEGEDVPGSQDELEKGIVRLGPAKARYFAMVTQDKTHFSFARGVGGRPTWDIRGEYPSETLPKVQWMEAMAKLCVAAARIPGLQYEVLARSESSWAEFPPQPPLARYNHVVTVTDAEVADAYDDPDSFWQCWDRVERVGDHRVCIRALDKLEVRDWLDETFESTMYLARIAKPKRTNYLTPGNVRPAFAPWWEYGDIIADERAGYPALLFVGYAPSTRTIEYAGFCTDTDIAKGGPDPRHVLIREIHEVRALIKAKKDRQGHPVDTVRIVFAEEWMARRERRPLLDVGARVFFMDRKTGSDIEIKD